MKNITQRIREAYKKSKDPVDRTGIYPFLFTGWWKGLDISAAEHDRCYIRVSSGVGPETSYKECDENFKRSLQFYAKGDWLKLLVTALACGVVSAWSSF